MRTFRSEVFSAAGETHVRRGGFPRGNRRMRTLPSLRVPRNRNPTAGGLSALPFSGHAFHNFRRLPEAGSLQPPAASGRPPRMRSRHERMSVVRAVLFRQKNKKEGRQGARPSSLVTVRKRFACVPSEDTPNQARSMIFLRSSPGRMPRLLSRTKWMNPMISGR